MFEPLIRETAGRFPLGDNAGSFVRMIVDAIFDDDTGGFAGMRGRFAHAGLGDLFASWIGVAPGDHALQPDQFSSGFGQDAGSRIAETLDIPTAAVNAAGAFLLPRIVGLLTRGGIAPTARPADYDRWFLTETPRASAAAHEGEPARGGRWKWLPPLVLLVATFFLFRSCQEHEAGMSPAAKPAAATAPAAQANPRVGVGHDHRIGSVASK